MTLKKLLQQSLRRTGLDETSSPFVDQARDHFNIGTKRLSERRAWRWLFKATTLTTVADQRTYSLASDVMRPLSFRNATDDFTMDMVDVDLVDSLDPDADETGPPRVVYVSGINTSTGYWEVDLYPLPDDSATTIRYRYYAFIADKTSSDDDTDLAATMPAWAQSAMVYYVSSSYKGDLGDLEGESVDYALFEQIIRDNIATDTSAETGNKRDRMMRPDEDYPQGFNFYVQEGSLT